jgi:hypothetical protein
MADTQRGDFKDLKCSDCGRPGCSFQHWGSMVPEGPIGNFCWSCWFARNADFDATGAVKPLGTIWRKVPDEFLNKAITVRTGSGSIYKLGKPNAKGLRTVSLTRTGKMPLHFKRAIIILLSVGANMCLLVSGKNDYITNKVVSIE